MTESIELSHGEMTMLAKDRVTVGGNPYKDQQTRRKKAIDCLEQAQDHLARMGIVYKEYNLPDHEEYCKAAFLAITPIIMVLREFASDM